MLINETTSIYRSQGYQRTALSLGEVHHKLSKIAMEDSHKQLIEKIVARCEFLNLSFDSEKQHYLAVQLDQCVMNVSNYIDAAKVNSKLANSYLELAKKIAEEIDPEPPKVGMFFQSKWHGLAALVNALSCLSTSTCITTEAVSAAYSVAAPAALTNPLATVLCTFTCIVSSGFNLFSACSSSSEWNTYRTSSLGYNFNQL